LNQRSKIQEESLYHQNKKHDGSLPIVGLNTFLLPQDHNGGHGENLTATDTCLTSDKGG